MWAPGLVGLVLGVTLLLTVRDSPEAIGYPPVETVEKKEVHLSTHLHAMLSSACICNMCM